MRKIISGDIFHYTEYLVNSNRLNDEIPFIKNGQFNYVMLLWDGFDELKIHNIDFVDFVIEKWRQGIREIHFGFVQFKCDGFIVDFSLWFWLT